MSVFACVWHNSVSVVPCKIRFKTVLTVFLATEYTRVLVEFK